MVELWRKAEVWDELFIILYKFMKFNLLNKFNVNMLTLSTLYRYEKMKNLTSMNVLSWDLDQKESEEEEC
jgi:hypothetical protein